MISIIEPVDCIINAAGLSSRMGEWKMMMPYKNATILDTSINNALGFCRRVILVVGHRGEELEQKYAQHPDILLVKNEQYRQGLMGSVKLGIQEVKSNYFFITHGDMPFISPETYQKMWQKKSDSVLFPGTPAEAGHPVLIPAKYKTNLIEDSRHSSMKKLLMTFPVNYLSLDDKRIHLDIDTQQDYKNWCC
ncbi:molybdenum cofactor cytidylyltransferase [Vibrio sp. SCSIO 43137]|uniref:molybdenum cofactor cytidylyltransferase n=1 Tax=Vibrio sp. SCSIO 43137 TaxID=3021011 RepID=UPI002306E659|nr:molybdenum cofactor cytidylyltransferase [Vibrio sp. SCSIO 43137]WCE31695.1 molybdenum cofactor cytidylyltransferase [Vibrio sp. SCSIO 43137]